MVIEGWRPMLRQRWGGKLQRPSDQSGLVTLFVDDIPEKMDSRRCVRSYEEKERNRLKVQGNGLWWDDKRIKVKKADFKKAEQRNSLKKGEVDGARNSNQGRLKTDTTMRKGNDNFPRQGREAVRGMRSYAEVVSRGKKQGNDHITVFTKEEGNGWLYESVVVKLKSFFSFYAFKEKVWRRGYKDVLVREGGGRLAVLTFPLAQAFTEGAASLKEWTFEWGDSLSDVSKSESVDYERCVWIYCLGVPLNLWSVNTFKSIGRVWGEVVQIDEDTSMLRSFQFGRVRILTMSIGNINRIIYLNCNKRLFPVRVYEVVEALHSVVDNTSRSDNMMVGVGTKVDQNSYHGGRRRMINQTAWRVRGRRKVMRWTLWNSWPARGWTRGQSCLGYWTVAVSMWQVWETVTLGG
ncbi:hypothetical protein ACSBR1_015343 [Camellia fascicularis]